MCVCVCVCVCVFVLTFTFARCVSTRLLVDCFVSVMHRTTIINHDTEIINMQHTSKCL